MEIANLVVASFLCGLIWTIQLVHYPLFAAVGQSGWPAYEAEHQRRITVLVLPVMAANVALGVVLFLQQDTWLALANAALTVKLFLATGLVYAPLHGKLAGAWDAATARTLVRLNWLRTAGWSAQVALAVAIV